MTTRHKIIIDTDPGVDDVLAILLALASPEVDVALISVVFGNTHAPQTFTNLLKLYHNLGIELQEHPEARERYAGVLDGKKTLVAIGEDDPIGGQKHVATYFHGKDGLSNITQTHPEFDAPEFDPSKPHEFLEFTDKSAWKAILDMLRTEPEGTVTIVALGPLTNVAWALQEDPETFKRVAEVVWMGGTLDRPGNTSPVAEFNSFADPYAFADVLAGAKAGLFRFTFAPLDITTPHMIPFTDLLHPALIPGATPEIIASVPPPTRLQAFTTSFLLRVRGLQAKFGLPDAMEMHDPVAVWYAIANGGKAGSLASAWTVTGREFAVERNGEVTRGMCVVDRRGTGETPETNRTEDKSLTEGQVGTESLGPGGKEPPSITPEPSPEKEADKQLNALPLMISTTPGSEVLRRELLRRVFGTSI